MNTWRASKADLSTLASDWRPTASREILELRARSLAQIRSYFAEQGVMEVETPLLSASTTTDPYLKSIRAQYSAPGGSAGALYLQTSPEFAMKRLLAAGSGPIYQICKAFRDGEAGRLHNPEFTLLEWYRPGYDLCALMDEVEELLKRVLVGWADSERYTYADVFERHAGIDPHTATPEMIQRCVRRFGLERVQGLDTGDRDGWLDLLLSHAIEPHLGKQCPTFVFDYPVSQAGLARIRPGSIPVAERFELYIHGIELANGYHELVDADEQRRRFEKDLEKRLATGLPDVEHDARLLAAMEYGLPPCSGVAMGLDRLVMLIGRTSSLAGAMAFPIERA